jgi:hypothetical protein
MTELIDLATIQDFKQYLSNAHSQFLRTGMAYVLQLERERDGLLVRCQQLEAKLYPKDHGEYDPMVTYD